MERNRGNARVLETNLRATVTAADKREEVADRKIGWREGTRARVKPSDERTIRERDLFPVRMCVRFSRFRHGSLTATAVPLTLYIDLYSIQLNLAQAKRLPQPLPVLYTFSIRVSLSIFLSLSLSSFFPFFLFAYFRLFSSLFRFLFHLLSFVHRLCFSPPVFSLSLSLIHAHTRRRIRVNYPVYKHA